MTARKKRPREITLDSIRLTPELEEVMVAAISDIEFYSGDPMKGIVRWQYWFRRAFDLGIESIREVPKAGRKKP